MTPFLWEFMTKRLLLRIVGVIAHAGMGAAVDARVRNAAGSKQVCRKRATVLRATVLRATVMRVTVLCAHGMRLLRANRMRLRWRYCLLSAS